MKRDKHDFSGATTKATLRRYTLALARESRFWHRGYLHCDWLELCGRYDETMRLLLAEKVLREGASKLLGVNRDAGVLAANREMFGEGGICAWIDGEWNTVLEDPDPLSRVGVIVYDSFDNVDRDNLAMHLAPTLRFARAQQERLGQALLSINLSLRGIKKDEPDHPILVEYREWLSSWLGVELGPDDFLTYVSEGRKTPMHICWITLGY